MKKLLLYMGCAVALLSACDPNDEFIDTLNEETKAAGIDMPETLTLEEDDYSIVEKTDMFASKEEAATLIPQILTEKYAANASNDGDLLTVFYDFYSGGSEELLNYRKEHEVSTEEYNEVSDAVKELGFFTSNNSFADNIPAILASAYADAAEGDVYKAFAYEGSKSIDAAKYLEMGADEYKVIVDAVKADDAKKHLVEAKYGTSEYYYGANSYSKNFDARLYKWAAYDDYSAMSEDDLEDLIYDRMVEGLILLLKNQYPDATILDAGGNEITYVVQYAVYDGDKTKTKYLRFKCTAEGDALDFARVGSMYVNYKTEFYIYDGANWVVEDEQYRLTSEDYDSMGEEYGYPGKYNNFSSDKTADPDYYLPTFMNKKWAYALEGETKLIIYKYYNSGATELRVDEYTFSSELKWQKTATVENSNDKFVFDAETGWAIIVITTYEFADADYELTGDEKYKNFGYYDDKAGTYQDVEVENVLQAKINHVLSTRFPDAEEGALFEVTYKFYSSGATNSVKKRYQKEGDKFVLVVE